MLLSLGVLFTLRFFGLGETKPAIVTELRPQYRLIYVAPDPVPVVPVAYQHYIGPPEQILTPPDQQQQPLVTEHHNPRPILGNRVSDDDFDDDDDDSTGTAEGYEVSQFHSEDENGKVVYGFRSPNQERMEARDSDGTVRGMYSYLDASGNQVKMHYWDDGHGMHMAGNNLPIAMYQMPEFTPEVKAAREEHFRLYEAALTALKAAGLEIEGQELEDENDDEHFIVPPLNGGSNEHDPEGNPLLIPAQQNPSSTSTDEEDDFEHLMHEPVIIENESIEKDPVKEEDNDEEEEYPKYEYTPLHHHSAVPVQHVDNEEKESVAIENPELRSSSKDETAFWRRQGKSREMDAAETQDGSTSQKKSEQSPKNEEKQVDTPKADTKSSPTEEQINELPGGAKTFYYHFTHVIPKPVERVDDVSAITSGSLVQTSQQHPVYRSPVV